ncbi:MAG: hypothetical protein V4521_02235 [Pseudomonadota bacterium]
MASAGADLDGQSTGPTPWRDWALLGGAVAASAGLLWGVSGQPLVAAGFLGGVSAIGGW